MVRGCAATRRRCCGCWTTPPCPRRWHRTRPPPGGRDRRPRSWYSLPTADPIKQNASFLNTSILAPLSLYSHGLGWSAPNSTYNTGADISLTQNLVSTTRYGYFFENYHDFGWPTTSPDFLWFLNGSGGTGDDGNPLPNGLQNYPNGVPANAGTTTTPYLSSFTLFNADKHYQLNQDLAFFKSGWVWPHL